MEQQIRAYVRARIELEAAAGWSRLRRVPSTHTWKILDYLATLDAGRRALLVDAFVANALFLFDARRDPALHAHKAGHPEYRAFVEELRQMWSWNYFGARLLRGLVGELRSGRPSRAFTSAPAPVLRRAEAIRPATAGAIRKVVKQVCGERFGARAEKFDASTWHYHGTHQGRRFTLWIDYGGRSDQLRYHVEYDDAATGLQPKRLVYEQMLGVGYGHWDFVTADDLDESIRLLAELVGELVSIPDRLTR